MHYYAQIVSGRCVSELATEAAIHQPDMVEIGGSTGAFLGKLYDGSFFTAPVAVLPRLITVGAFFDRFGAQKYPILASSNPTVQALIKDSSVRNYIDLKDPVLAAGLAALLGAGFAIDPAAIVNAPVQPSEMP